MLSVSLSHSVGQCGPQLLVSHTLRKGDRRGRNDTQPAHRSRGSGPHETCLSVGTVAVDICLSPSLPGNNGSSRSLAKALCKEKKKGIPSGSTLHIRTAQFFLVRMREHKGHQCHTGRTTSFSRNESEDILPFG